jgi:hypothetical protein
LSFISWELAKAFDQSKGSIASFWNDADLGGRANKDVDDFGPKEVVELKRGCVGNGQYLVGEWSDCSEHPRSVLILVQTVL